MSDLDAIMLNILSKHKDADKWNGSLFERIKRVSNTKVGDVGQDFIEALCQKFNLRCEFPLNEKGVRSKNSPWDIEINGVKFELKTATEDVNGSFQFNHIRYHRSYEALICLGVSPSAIFFDCWSAAQVKTGRAGNLVSMERGANASYKLTKKPAVLHIIDEFDTELKKFLVNFSNSSSV